MDHTWTTHGPHMGHMGHMCHMCHMGHVHSSPRGVLYEQWKGLLPFHGPASGPHQPRMRLGPAGDFAGYFEPSADVPGATATCLESDSTMTFQSSQVTDMEWMKH